MKKSAIVFVCASLLLCVTASWLAYRQGVSDGFRAGWEPSSWAKFVMARAELDHLRTNQVASTIDRLEASCYSGADQMLTSGYLKGRAGLDQELRDLVVYRAQYAKPSEQWTPVERDLEARLKLWRNGQTTEEPEDVSQLVTLAHEVKRSHHP